MKFNGLWKLLVPVFALMLLSACGTDADLDQTDEPVINNEVNTEEPADVGGDMEEEVDETE